LPRFELRPHNCFACGSLNAHGLHLVLHVEHDRSATELTLDKSFEGWDGIAHGGIICTILDEVMAWSLVGSDNWGVTARMTVTFKRPVAIGRRLRAEGSITRERRRLIETVSQLTDAETGEILATAEGVYVAADGDRKRELRELYGFRLIGQVEPVPDGAADAGTTPDPTPADPMPADPMPADPTPADPTRPGATPDDRARVGRAPAVGASR
jgi:acyl-coenzyme A thioesterase PaaI-like protein